MPSPTTRRHFLQATAATLGAAALPRVAPAAAAEATSEPAFRVSLAEWSLHRTLWKGDISNLDFPEVTRKEFGIEAVEFVNGFFKDKAKDAGYLAELNKRCDSEGVRSLLIMCDGEGRLGDPNDAKRAKAVENHRKWLEAAATLGCHSIRVNASSAGSFEEQQKLAADGLARLGEIADGHGLNVLVENHGGLSSSGVWLAGVMKLAGRPNVGTLPDFGNFRIGAVDHGDRKVENWYDRYQGMKELMPFAKAVSAKSHEFDGEGNEVRTDFLRAMQIVHDAGYRGYVGVEWEGGKPGEYEGVRLTKRLLEKVFAQLG